MVALFLFTGCVVEPGAGIRGSGAGSGDGGIDAPHGDAACGAVKCQSLECGSGFIPIPLTGECCPTVCVPSDCSTVDCPPVDCPPGTTATSSNGSCCKQCVKTAAGLGTCADGQTGYASFLAEQLASAQASNCNTDGDCRLVALDNLCGTSCATAVSVRGAAALVSSTTAYANAHCGACSNPTPCPPVEVFAVCSGGVCTSY